MKMFLFSVGDTFEDLLLMTFPRDATQVANLLTNLSSKQGF